MTDLRNRRGLRDMWQAQRDSETLLGTVMAAIAMLFIAGIALAFLYAKDTNPLMAQHQDHSVGIPASAATALRPPAPGFAAGDHRFGIVRRPVDAAAVNANKQRQRPGGRLAPERHTARSFDVEGEVVMRLHTNTDACRRGFACC
jgi:hypothetical protein